MLWWPKQIVLRLMVLGGSMLDLQIERYGSLRYLMLFRRYWYSYGCSEDRVNKFVVVLKKSRGHKKWHFFLIHSINLPCLPYNNTQEAINYSFSLFFILQQQQSTSNFDIVVLMAQDGNFLLPLFFLLHFHIERGEKDWIERFFALFKEDSLPAIRQLAVKLSG